MVQWLYQHGVDFLLATQFEDGSWYVPSRAPKFQPYFESGFPYGPDQWISTPATAWATIALAPAVMPTLSKAGDDGAVSQTARRRRGGE